MAVESELAPLMDVDQLGVGGFEMRVDASLVNRLDVGLEFYPGRLVF